MMMAPSNRSPRERKKKQAERNKKNQIKPASGPRSSDIKKGRFRAALDVTSGDNFGSDPWRSSSRSSWIHGGKPRKRIHSFKNKSYRRAN